MVDISPQQARIWTHRQNNDPPQTTQQHFPSNAIRTILYTFPPQRRETHF